LFREAVASVIDAMKKGFPKVVDQLDAIQSGLLKEDTMSPEILDALTSGNTMDTQTVAGKLNVDPQLLETVMTQILKPFAQKRSESLPTLPETLQWGKGYCPVCGSWPELSFLEGKEGSRWLRCSFCAHEWKYLRTQCPFCENDDQTSIEIIFPEDKPYQRAELCSKCMKYIVSMDFRDLAVPLSRAIAALSLVHLDVLAQEKKYDPGAQCLWNTF
jgi:FdhE protein